MAPLLRVEDVVVGYGGTRVLKEVSLDVRAGEVLAVLGANGAGKSTLMRTIAGLLQPWEGRILFDGADITRLPAQERPVLGLALAPEGRGIFSELSIEENLLMGTMPLRRRLGAAERRRQVAEGLERVYGMFEVLGRRRRDNAAGLSGGQQQMVAIGRALISGPRLLLLDEPCLGLAPKVGSEVYDVLRVLREQGQSLILVDESSRRALKLADRGCVLKLGRKVLEDDAEALGGEGRLLEAYFGIQTEESANDR